MKSHYICISLCALLTLSCGGSASNQSVSATPTPTPDKSADEEWQAPIEKIEVSEIYPTADGGAYALTTSDRLWYVKEHWAYRVAESKAPISRAGIPKPGAAFVLLSAERQRARKLKEALDSAEFQIEELKAELKEGR